LNNYYFKKTFSENLQIILYTFAYTKRSKKMTTLTKAWRTCQYCGADYYNEDCPECRATGGGYHFTVQIVNLTPHEITEAESGISFSPSGQVARVETESKKIEKIGRIQLYSRSFGQVIDLPEPRLNTLFIVSALVLEAAKNRQDLLAPGELVRDEKGRPIACKGFVKN
jgi:hypothetical protein